jgi:hypothetical protein
MSEELAELTGGFDHSPDRLIAERAAEARRELRNSETDWEAVVREHREKHDENAGLGRLRLRPNQVSSLWTVTETGEVMVPLVDNEHEIETDNLSPQL